MPSGVAATATFSPRPPPEPVPRWLTVLCIVGGALAAVVLSIPFVVSTWVVEGDSMAPTLDAGERIVINKLAGDPSLGDVIVHRVVTPGGRRHDYVKRVVAVGGDTVSYLDVLSKNLGTNNPHNAVNATITALTELRDPELRRAELAR